MTREEKAQFCIDHPKKSPAFQFYPDNWWGSRHVTMMTVEQRGIHASLIFSAWLEDNCGIPNNEICLSARVQEDKKIIVDQVLSMCWFLYDGFWFCERLLKERVKQINLSFTRIDAGSKGGRPKKSKIYRDKPIGYQKDSKPKAKETKSEDENRNEIENRKKKFEIEINSFIQYPQEMRNNFILYWTELNKSETKMRFEIEKTWETGKRLVTWANRDRSFNSKTQFGRQEVSNETLKKQFEWDLTK